jgi:cell wall-associated NlpC family hydrolase
MKSHIRRQSARIALTLGAAALGVTLLGAPAHADDAVSTSDSATLVADAGTVTPTDATTPDATTTATATTTTTTTATFTTASTTTSTTASAASIRQAKAAKVIALAKKYSGRPYRWGAAGPKAFDCTGYTKFIYKKIGVKLPHSGAQGKKGKKVSRKNAIPGDLVIFRDSSGRVFHVGIYAGKNKMYDAPTYGKKTGKHRIWSKHVEFRRMF